MILANIPNNEDWMLNRVCELCTEIVRIAKICKEDISADDYHLKIDLMRSLIGELDTLSLRIAE